MHPMTRFARFRPSPLARTTYSRCCWGTRQGLTLVHFSAPPKPFLKRKHPLHTPWYPFTTPKHPLKNPQTHPISHRKRLR